MPLKHINILCMSVIKRNSNYNIKKACHRVSRVNFSLEEDILIIPFFKDIKMHKIRNAFSNFWNFHISENEYI